MGFRPEPTIYKLVFDESHPLYGLVVRVKCLTVREFSDMTGWIDDDSVTAKQNNDRALQLFLDKVVEWNLENPEDGEPTSKTLEGIAVHEQPLVRELMRSWNKVMWQVSDELGKDSTNGNTSLERSLQLGG